MHSTNSINVLTEGEAAVDFCYLVTVRMSRKKKDFWNFLTSRQGHLNCSFVQMSKSAPENQIPLFWFYFLAFKEEQLYISFLLWVFIWRFY